MGDRIKSERPAGFIGIRNLEHRRNLYHIAVGQEGVLLAQKIRGLDSDIADKQTLIKNDERVIQQHVPKAMKLDVFVSLEDDVDIEIKITEAITRLKMAENTIEISQQSKLNTIIIPCLPDTLRATLETTLGNVSFEASNRVKEQLDKHGFHGNGELWLDEGLKHITGNDCPFCGNNLEGSTLIEIYQGYFSDAYTRLKRALLDLRETTKTTLSQTTILTTVHAFKNVVEDVKFWSRYATIDFNFSHLLPLLEEKLQTLSRVAIDMIEIKIGAPLEPLSNFAAFDEAIEELAVVSRELTTCNEAIMKANTIIQGVKENNANQEKAIIEAEIAKLKAIKTRRTEPALGLIQNYERMLKEKEDLVKDRDKVKGSLDDYDKRILGAYEDDINEFLKSFGASFTLTNSAKNYLGQSPQVAYCIQFDEANVDITADGKDGNPSFGTTMSAGDKNTLALAFFLAQVMRDNSIGNKIVVFDDPFSSLDDFRREVTAYKIIRVGEKAAQIVVFSHDKYFLDALRTKIRGVEYLTMQISCTKGNSAIECWDIEREVKEGYLQDHMSLQEFTEDQTTDARTVLLLLRPLLEKYIRYRFPNQINEGMWLGDMLGVIRGNSNHPLQSIYQELDEINGYTKPFHHDPNANFNSDEVMLFAKRTLKIVGGWE